MDAIRNECNEKIEKRNDMIEKYRETKKSLEESYVKLLEFGKKHYEELISIFEFRSRCGEVPFGWEFLGDPLNQITHRIDYEERFLDHEITNIGIFDDEWVLITYSDLEKRTGLSSLSLKKYLEEMERKNMFKRKRHICGYVYSIKDWEG